MKKAPRRTAERILEVTLALFNRFGEPNVSTTLISNELRISPGNLYYHYPAKDELINALAERFELALHPLLNAAEDVRHVEDAWFFMHSLFEQIWQYRFLYRDLNDLLSNNRALEQRFQRLALALTRALRELIDGLRRGGAFDPRQQPSADLATSMAVLLTYWLSFEYVRDPRRALEPTWAQTTLLRGAQHVLLLLEPYLEAAQRAHLAQLSAAYNPATQRPA